MNIRIMIEIGAKTGRYGSIEHEGRGEIIFDWPDGLAIPKLGEIVEGLTTEAYKNHLKEKETAEAE